MGAMSKSPLWALLQRGGAALAGVVTPVPDRAEMVSWYEGLGHLSGQVTDWQEAGGLMVRLRVGGISSKGGMLFRAELFNPGQRSWRGGVNLGDRPMTESEAVLTIGPSGNTDWWTHLPPRTCQVFVRIDPDARSNS